MTQQNKCYRINLKFPSDIDYIPPIRKYISEMLQINNFGTKFAYRSEIIVDEICNNAVSYGSSSVSASVQIGCEIYADRVEFIIKDEGGSQKNIDNLKTVVSTKAELPSKDIFDGHCRGLEIVRMLSEKVDLDVDDNNVTSIRIVRRREDPQDTKSI